jgi:hypothetical protein
VNTPLLLQRGEAVLQKTDIFKRIMWFGFKNDNNWYPAPVARVKEILELNARGITVDSLTIEEKVEQQKKIEQNAQLESNLERLDEKYKNKKKKKKKNKNGTPPAAGLAGLLQSVSDSARPSQENRPNQERRPGAARAENRPDQERKPNVPRQENRPNANGPAGGHKKKFKKNFKDRPRNDKPANPNV